MIQIRPSQPGELEGQKKLWEKAFGDEDCYINWFYKTCGEPGTAMLLLDDEVLISMLSLMPMDIVLPGGEVAHAEYVYALATDPKQRQKGYGRQLLHYTDFHLRARGADCVTVVPAEPSLHRFFGTADFVEAFPLRKLELLRSMVEKPGEIRACPVNPAQYGQIREKLLRGTTHVQYGESLLEYQQGMSHMGNADLYQIEVDGVTGCAAAEYVDKESLLLKELVIPRQQMPGAVAQLAAVLPAVRYHVRTPAFWDGMPGSYIQPFGMIKWYNQNMQRIFEESGRGYMGLGFD